MKPNDFNVPMMEQFHRLRKYAIARSGSYDLDKQTTMWLVPYSQKRRLFAELSPMTDYVQSPPGKTLILGIPVRFTCDDPEGTPEIQLVMEPTLFVPSKLRS